MIAAAPTTRNAAAPYAALGASIHRTATNESNWAVTRLQSAGFPCNDSSDRTSIPISRR
jgi:hypothetical protein